MHSFNARAIEALNIHIYFWSALPAESGGTKVSEDVITSNHKWEREILMKTAADSWNLDAAAALHSHQKSSLVAMSKIMTDPR